MNIYSLYILEQSNYFRINKKPKKIRIEFRDTQHLSNKGNFV